MACIVIVQPLPDKFHRAIRAESKKVWDKVEESERTRLFAAIAIAHVADPDIPDRVKYSDDVELLLDIIMDKGLIKEGHCLVTTGRELPSTITGNLAYLYKKEKAIAWVTKTTDNKVCSKWAATHARGCSRQAVLAVQYMAEDTTILQTHTVIVYY